MKNWITDTFIRTDGSFCPSRTSSRYLNKSVEKEKIDQVKELTQFLPEDCLFSLRLNCILKDIIMPPLCKHCNSQPCNIKKNNFIEFCSKKCAIQYSHLHENDNTDKIHYSQITKEMLEECFDKGMTQREMAEYFQTARDLIRNKCKEFGIEITNRRTQAFLDRELLIKEHHINKLSLLEISIKYNRGYSSIKNMFKRLNIDIFDLRLHKEKISRTVKFEDVKLEELYGQLTKIEIQKKIGVGQYYLDLELKNRNIIRKFFNISSQEREIKEFIESIYRGQIVCSNRSIIAANKEIDIFIPEFSFGIEVHGLYYHSVNPYTNKTGKEHVQKYQESRSKGFKLFQIFEDEWLDKKDICKSIITHHLNCNEKIYARKCEVKVVEYSTAKQFCEDNHLQGSSVASIYIGLYYNNELVSLMSFGKPRFQSSQHNEWELVRYCSKLYLDVIGGASKILSFFVKQYSPKSIFSYADSRISTGKIYETLGFKYVRTTEPNYFYVINKARSNRMSWMKHLLKNKLSNFDENLTEKENMANNKYWPIYDAGNTLWKWESETHLSFPSEDPTSIPSFSNILPYALTQKSISRQKQKEINEEKRILEKEELVKKVYELYSEQNKTIKETSEILGFGTEKISNVIKEHPEWPHEYKNEGRPKDNPDFYITREELERLYNDGMTQEEIAKHVGTTKWQIQKYFKEYNLIPRQKQLDYQSRSVLDNEEDFRKLYNDSKSVEELEKKIGVSRPCILSRLKRYNLPKYKTNCISFPGNKDKQEELKKRLIELNETLTLTEISVIYNTSVSTISLWFKKLGILVKFH